MANVTCEVSITVDPESRALIERFTAAAEALGSAAGRAPEYPEILEAADALLNLADALRVDGPDS